MAVLGSGGAVLLARPCPVPCDLNGEHEVNIGTERCEELVWRDDFLPFCDAFQFTNCGGWLSGDHASIECLPTYDPISGLPYKPDGYASYQESKYFVGPNRWHIKNNADKFYKDEAGECYPDNKCRDDANFYAKPKVGGVPEGCGSSGDWWIHIDEFGRIRFYDSRCAAIGGCPSKAINLAPIWIGDDPIILEPHGTSDYQNALWDCFYDDCKTGGDYGNSDVQDNYENFSICLDAPRFALPEADTAEYLNDDVQPRPFYSCSYPKIQCDLREYSLTLDAPAVDTTAVSEKFGENVKSLVRGGGTFEFFVDRSCLPENAENSSWDILNMLFLTEGGGSQQPIAAEAWFYLIVGNGCENCFPPAAGDLYYKADILITQTAINVRPTDMIVGTATFVTTGEIKLLQAP